MKSYKPLQFMAYEFMDKFNLIFKTCQTTIFEDKELKVASEKFIGDFNAIVPQFDYRNYEIYNLDETLTKLYLIKFLQLKELKKRS